MLTDGAARLFDAVRSKRRQSERRTETVLRVARTVADLAPSEHVEAEHVAEALGLQRAALDAPCANRCTTTGCTGPGLAKRQLASNRSVAEILLGN